MVSDGIAPLTATTERRFGAHDFRVINSGGIDVGIMTMTVATDCVKVHQLFLLPEHQGKGIGGKCMSLILEEARQLDLPVRLRVMKANPRALAFYRRLGFTRTGETDTHDLMEKHPQRKSCSVSGENKV